MVAPAGVFSEQPRPDTLARDGDILTVGRFQLTVIHTPGHTPGSICLVSGQHLFSGDTLFPGGPGKTRSPEAFQAVVQSITQKLFPLPDETQVHPGHGADTVLSKEKKEYAFFASRGRGPGLFGDVAWLTS